MAPKVQCFEYEKVNCARVLTLNFSIEKTRLSATLVRNNKKRSKISPNDRFEGGLVPP